MEDDNAKSIAWRKSAASGLSGCVEVAVDAMGFVLVRDSKDPNGPNLRFTPSEWTSFIKAAKIGDFDNLNN
jgi:hypothetical protein